jgi:hypothetical protein
VEGAIQGMNITFTADTEAARTVVSAKHFHKIPLSKRPTLQKLIISVLGGITKWSADRTLLTVSGCPIWMHGILVLFSSIIPSVSLISAGPPSPFIKIYKPNKASSSILAIITPPKTEMIIEVFVDRFETDDFTKPQYFLIEPHSYFIETHPVVMASCLVDIRNEVTNKIRLMNFTL